MVCRPPLALVILLLSFPQIVETIYSPALPNIATAYQATPEEAAQTLSLWFVAFAVGVICWGRLCDLAGRRPSLLAGLAFYALGSGWAMITEDFTHLLFARVLSAFGAAVGSIVVQTALRDSFRGPDLARIFSLLGLALAVSPAIGMFLGQQIAFHAGHRAVFATLGLLAVTLLGLGFAFWPETRPSEEPVTRFLPTLHTMLRDSDIWCTAVLIAVFNLAIFGYYQLGPFRFEQLQNNWLDFGDSGLVLAAASLLGAWTNARLLRYGKSPNTLLGVGVLLLAIGSILVFLLSSGPAFLIGMAVVALAYAIAIPNILANALRRYADRLGTAGALLSMLYYMLLGVGLMLAGWGQNLEYLLLACAMLGVLALLVAQMLPR